MGIKNTITLVQAGESDGKINKKKATMMLDYGVEVSIIDTTFACKIGCMIDESQTQKCVGIGETHT